MTDSIGPKQRELIAALQGGAELLQRNGQWRVRHDRGMSYIVNRERCMALYVRGFLMADGETDGATRYTLTTKGRAVC